MDWYNFIFIFDISQGISIADQNIVLGKNNPKEDVVPKKISAKSTLLGLNWDTIEAGKISMKDSVWGEINSNQSVKMNLASDEMISLSKLFGRKVVSVESKPISNTSAKEKKKNIAPKVIDMSRYKNVFFNILILLNYLTLEVQIVVLDLQVLGKRKSMCLM